MDVEYDSEPSSEGDGCDWDQDGDVSLESIRQSLTVNFSIRANYTTWTPREAFRELIQNWRDGIIKSYKISERDFHTHVFREENISGHKTEIIFRVLLPNSEPKKWVGYIRFLGRDGKGTVDITNRAATLEPWHLDLGGTTKAGDSHQAGAHGEGLKIALLVLMRNPQNHQVRCRTGGFNWRFNFTNRGRLVARLGRMKPGAVKTAMEKSSKDVGKDDSLLPFAVDPNKDVQFVIGERSMGRDQKGSSVKRDLVTLDEFNDWAASALFLQKIKDGQLVLSRKGDLICDPELRGRIYLKGLLLGESTDCKSASITGKKLKLGYNFLSGATNRERQSVANARQESQAIFSIWNEVTKAETLTKELHEMMNCADVEYADVSMAKEYLKADTALALKSYLFGQDKKEKWYYTAEEKGNDPMLDQVIEGLGCVGVEMKMEYWAVMEKYGHIRTASEEAQKRFLAAAPVEAPLAADGFGGMVSKLLRSCVLACPQTMHLEVHFVDAGPLHLSVLHVESQRALKVHSRWLAKNLASEELGLLPHTSDDDMVFQAVKTLFHDAVHDLPPASFERGEGNGEEKRSAAQGRATEVRFAEQRLLEYLRIQHLYILVPAQRGRLCVSWPSEAGWPANTTIALQVHHVECRNLFSDGLVVGDFLNSNNIPCLALSDDETPTQGPGTRCQAKSVPIKFGNCDFRDLTQDAEYFVVAAVSSDPGAFLLVSACSRTNGAPEPRRSTMPTPDSEPAGGNVLVSASNSTGAAANTPLTSSSPAPPLPADSYSDSDVDMEEVIEAEPRSARRSGPPTASRKRARTAQTESEDEGHESGVGKYGPVILQVADPEMAGRTISRDGAGPWRTFSVGSRLKDLNVFDFDKDRWFDAVDHGGQRGARVVVGYRVGEEIPQ